MRRFSTYLLVFFSLSLVLYFGKTLFIPLFMGLLIAIVMYPICKKLEKARFPKSLAIAVCLLIVGVLFGAILSLFVWQVNVFGRDAPVFLAKLEKAMAELQIRLNSYLGSAMALEKINWYEKLTGPVTALFKNAVSVTINTGLILFLTPIYTALFLYHRRTFIAFLKAVTPSRYQHQLDAIVDQTIHTYFNYIKGMVWVYVIVGILNSIGLLLLGVDHAILFGMLCAIMTIIPYIGIIVSALLPITVVWMATGNIWYPIGVVAIFVFVQYLEANVIFPRVVGMQLNVSTLAMLVAIVAGGIIWGVIGMILFIPFVAILKIVSDHIEEWKPLNILISRK